MSQMSIIITIAHQKGGVGKSTLTYLIANAFTTAAVAIIDKDHQGTLYQIKPAADKINYYPADQDPMVLQEDFIFIDTPPYLSEGLEELFKKSSCIIVPTKAGIADLLAIRSTITLIDKTNSISKTLVVINMIKPNTTLTKAIREQLEIICPVAKTEISDRVEITRSLLNGIKNKEIQKQLDQLAEEIINVIKNSKK